MYSQIMSVCATSPTTADIKMREKRKTRLRHFILRNKEKDAVWIEHCQPMGNKTVRLYKGLVTKSNGAHNTSDFVGGTMKTVDVTYKNLCSKWFPIALYIAKK